MERDIHTMAILLTYYLLDNSFFVNLAHDKCFAAKLPEGIDAIVSRMESLIEGVDESSLDILRQRAAFYESFLD